MKFAVLLALVAFVAVTAAEEFKCQAGVPYKENECNGCFCSPTNAALACTQMACIGPGANKHRNCEVGTTFEKGCNKCWCAKDLGTICEDKKC